MMTVVDDDQADVIAVVRTVIQNSSSHSDGSEIVNSLTVEKIISALAIFCIIGKYSSSSFIKHDRFMIFIILIRNFLYLT